MIEIYNKDCIKFLSAYSDKKFDVVLTSPPYNNSRTSHTEYSMSTSNCRYAEYDDNKTNEEYVEWTVKLFNLFDKTLVKNGTVLYNISYGSENPDIMWETLFNIVHRTPFFIAENIVWKKSSAFPNNVSPNKLTRVTEPVYVFCRRDEYETFYTNKKVRSQSRTGQKFYENIFNLIEARNNDGTNELNNATYSSELCEKLLKIYCPKDGLVYDPFMGTGTTAMACKRMGINCIGTEISESQVKYAINRLQGVAYKGEEIFNKEKLW